MSNVALQKRDHGSSSSFGVRRAAIEFAIVHRAILLWLGIAGALMIIPVSAIAALRARRHSLLSDTISDLAAQDAPSATFMRIGLILFGVCVLAFAAGIGQTVPRSGTGLWITLSVFGACVVLVGIFQDYSEVPGTARNREGYLHNSFGLLAIGGLVLSMVIAAVISSRSDQWRGLLPITSVCLLMIVVSGSAFTWGSERYEGLAELIVYGAALVWLLTGACFGLASLRTARSGENPGSGRVQQSSASNLTDHREVLL